MTGVLCTIIPSMTAVMAGKPSATSNGAVIAAGVPNPDAPSMKLPKSQLMMMTWTLRSGVIFAKPARIAAMAPECFNVLSNRIAAKMMNRISNEMKSPWIDAAAIWATGMVHAKKPITTARM